MNIEDWFPLELTGLIFLQSKGLSRVFSNTAVQKHHGWKVKYCIWRNMCLNIKTSYASVQFSHIVMSDSLQPHGWEHPGSSVLHCLPELAQTHVHWVSDAIQPSHPLSPPSPPAFNLSQHQGLFQWVSSSHQAAKILELQLQQQSFHWIFRVDFL